MPRPENERIVHEPPLFTEFKPAGVPGKDLKELLLSLDEFEAMRLADYIGMSHEEAADEMGISGQHSVGWWKNQGGNWQSLFSGEGCW